MKTLLSLSSTAVVLVSLVLGGCAADADEGDRADEANAPVAVAVDLDNVTPSRLGASRTGYTPQVKLADLKAAGARCVGTHCDYNGQSWDCSGGGYCSSSGQQ